MVVGDQGALVGRVDLPVPADPGGQGEQTLGDPDPDPGQGAAAMALQPELVFEGVEGALDPRPPTAQRAVPVGLVGAVGTQQRGATTSDQLLEVLTGFDSGSSGSWLEIPGYIPPADRRKPIHPRQPLQLGIRWVFEGELPRAFGEVVHK